MKKVSTMTPEENKAFAEKYFFIDDQMQDYLEANAKEVMHEYKQTYLLHKQSAEKLLTLMLTGLSAIFVFLLKALSSNGWGALETGYLVLIIGWLLCSYGLLQYCIRAQDMKMASSTPSRLLIPEHESEGQYLSIDKLKRFRLAQYDLMIHANRNAVFKTATSLNTIRFIAAITPVVAGIMALLHYCLT